MSLSVPPPLRGRLDLRGLGANERTTTVQPTKGGQVVNCELRAVQRHTQAKARGSGEVGEGRELEAPHLDLLHLLLIGGVHLLQGLLQLLVPLQQGLPELRS